jgi:hypothetical protein
LLGNDLDNGQRAIVCAKNTQANVIDSSRRAMFRDARKAGLEAAFPFGDLDWPRRVVPGPDPFIEEERNAVGS